MDFQTPAAKSFYRAVRDFAEAAQRKPTANAVYYTSSPDETNDLTLVSFRVYGRRDEFLVVMAAAGLSSTSQPLPQATELALPSDALLTSMKRRAGFESVAVYRLGDRPVWADG